MHRGNLNLPFTTTIEPSRQQEDQTQDCRIESRGKRRDGGTRYWCLTHHSDATAKYGRPLSVCKVGVQLPRIPTESHSLELDQFKGGVAIWGAVPPVYDTTRLPMERGIHVHARLAPGGRKAIDDSFESLKVFSTKLPGSGMEISELDSIYFMVSSVLGFETIQVLCTYCGHSHLDRDFFSVHPHRRHLCSNCGKHFQDDVKSIGNPIGALRNAMGVQVRPPIDPNRTLDIKQGDYPGGLQIWGTNSAILWTGDKAEEDGIHVHGFKVAGAERAFDQTYSEVCIDGHWLNAAMIRTLMAQRALPLLNGRIQSVECETCGEQQFDTGAQAFHPRSERDCHACSSPIRSRGKFRNIVANPAIKTLELLSKTAVRSPQFHDLGLAPESLSIQMPPKRAGEGRARDRTHALAS